MMEKIEFVPVRSSNIEAVAHDGNETMLVKFHHGGTYRYDGVTVAGHKKMMEAESIGHHLRMMNVKGVKL